MIKRVFATVSVCVADFALIQRRTDKDDRDRGRRKVHVIKKGEQKHPECRQMPDGHKRAQIKWKGEEKGKRGKERGIARGEEPVLDRVGGTREIVATREGKILAGKLIFGRACDGQAIVLRLSWINKRAVGAQFPHYASANH